MIRMAILDTAFDRKKGFFKNVNVGDHAVVAAAAQKAEDTLQTYCPKGMPLIFLNAVFYCFGYILIYFLEYIYLPAVLIYQRKYFRNPK